MKKFFLTITIITLFISFAFYNKSEAVDISPIKNSTVGGTVYHLLAPIGIKGDCIDTSGLDTSCAGGGIGDYFNIILQLTIGICGVLAVIMIVVSGIQYIGDESVFGKTEAKGKIINSILGLLIAIGSYAILNTINPQLLGKGGINIQSVSIQIEPAMDYNDALPLPGAPAGDCTEGIVTITTTNNKTFPVCSDISDNLKNMINQAYADGFNISGYGFRSKDTQIKLRVTNCNGNTTDANAECTPPTALPGTSMHESGRAFDLKCDGDTIRAQDNKCFVWLKTYASTYGFLNLPSEPWHWSTTGH